MMHGVGVPTEYPVIPHAGILAYKITLTTTGLLGCGLHVGHLQIVSKYLTFGNLSVFEYAMAGRI